MKKEILSKMINNAPQGSTHYRKTNTYVVFYANVDNNYGSHDKMYWFFDEEVPDGCWFTVRERLSCENLVQL